MRILALGGTGFIGHFVARALAEAGHDVTVFHRHSTESGPAGIRHVYGDRHKLEDHAPALRALGCDVVIDFILSSRTQAEALVRTFRGAAGRLVVLSSADVYRACGILYGYEPGGLQEVPLTEDAALRTRLQPYPASAIDQLRQTLPWLDHKYDKIPVEQAVRSEPTLPATVLRLPMVYGPGDPLHRCHPVLKRIDDSRPALLLQREAAAWRGPRGYVEDIAHGIALAATLPQAAGRVYNLSDATAWTEQEWTQRIARAAGFQGRIVLLSRDRTPAHLRGAFRNEQHWVLNTDRIRAELGYAEIVEPEEAMRRTVEWERAHPPARLDERQFDYAAEDAALQE